MKTILEMAREAGFWQEHADTYMCSTDAIKSFETLVRADERDACAKVCENLPAAQRQWVELTDEERMECIFSTRWSTTQLMDTSKAIEAKLKERNT